jgi:leader peptidase (prepilin peptidase)/N-methyltransferase
LSDDTLIVFVVAVLVVLSWYDVRQRIIPNRIVLPAWIAVLAAQLLLHPDQWLEWLLASMLTALVFLVPALLYPAGFGMGDVKLVGLLGAALGYGVLNGLLIGTLLAAVFAAGLLVRGGAAARRTTFAYGPFLAAGGVAALLF